MKHCKYVLLICIFFLSKEYIYSQVDKKGAEILFSIQDSNLNPNVDTIYFLKEKNNQLYFYNDKVYYNKKEIYAFKKIEYYLQLIFMSTNNINYLYIYPKYQGRSGPYIWYGLGMLFEINDKEIIIKSNYDFYDSIDLDLLFFYEKYKIVRKIKLKKH